MSKQLIDLNLFLPKFYPISQQIDLKLTPVLRNLRSSNIVSYHQIQNKPLFSQQLQTLPNTETLRHTLVTNSQFSRPKQNQSVFDNKNTQFNPAKTAFSSNSTSQKNRNTFYSTLQTPDRSKTPQRIRNDSFQIRSKTSHKIKSKKSSQLAPATADFANNPDQSDFQKLNIYIKNPQTSVEFDDDFCNYIRLKMLTKNPYFTGGKFSKIKKHLVQEINLEEIEQKFFKSTTKNTKYIEFFQQIMLKKKQHASQRDKFNKSAFHTLSPKKSQTAQNGQRDQKNHEQKLLTFNISKFSQNTERQESPQSKKGFSRQRSKRLTMKAKLLFRKSPIKSNASTNLVQETQETNSKQMEVKGYRKTQSPTLQKYLQTRKHHYNVHKDLMKRAYRLNCQ